MEVGLPQGLYLSSALVCCSAGETTTGAQVENDEITSDFYDHYLVYAWISSRHLVVTT